MCFWPIILTYALDYKVVCHWFLLSVLDLVLIELSPSNAGDCYYILEVLGANRDAANAAQWEGITAQTFFFISTNILL